jgi:hypothetical protein
MAWVSNLYCLLLIRIIVVLLGTEDGIHFLRQCPLFDANYLPLIPLGKKRQGLHRRGTLSTRLINHHIWRARLTKLRLLFAHLRETLDRHMRCLISHLSLLHVSTFVRTSQTTSARNCHYTRSRERLPFPDGTEDYFRGIFLCLSCFLLCLCFWTSSNSWQEGQCLGASCTQRHTRSSTVVKWV